MTGPRAKSNKRLRRKDIFKAWNPSKELKEILRRMGFDTVVELTTPTGGISVVRLYLCLVGSTPSDVWHGTMWKSKQHNPHGYTTSAFQNSVCLPSPDEVEDRWRAMTKNCQQSLLLRTLYRIR